MKYLLLLLLFFASSEVFAQGRCFRLEGVRLLSRGQLQCTQQAQPLECGPPKPCLPCTYYETCGTKTKTVRGGGNCLTPGDPVCNMVGDVEVCTPGPCKDYAPQTCSEVSVSCGNNAMQAESTGTYSCSYNECSCNIPAGACLASETCSGDESCNN